MNVDVNAVYEHAETCLCGAPVELLSTPADAPEDYMVWVHADREGFDHAAVPAIPSRIPEAGHVYACCGKTGRISRHESWCPVMAGTT